MRASGGRRSPQLSSLTGCAPAGSGAETPAATGLPNPAAVCCVDGGGTYEIPRTANDGSQSEVCVLADGTQVDAWEHFRTKAAQ